MKYWFFFFLLILLSYPVFAAPRITIDIIEEGKVTSYYSEYWVVNVKGTITITNQYNNSFDFLQFPYDLGSLTIIEDNATSYLSSNLMYVPYIAAGETITFSYKILGVQPYDPMENNKSVFRSALVHEHASLYTFLISKIQKAPIENATIDTNEIISKKDRRLITITLENPSDIQQNVSSVKVIKTIDQNITNPIAQWYFPDDGVPITIPPHKRWTHDIIDYNATPGEVYWISTDAKTDTVPVLVGDHIIKRFTEEDLYNVANASIDEKEYLKNVTDYLEHLMYIKKTVSDNYMLPGKDITLTIKVNNFAPIHRDFNLTDTIPEGFVINDSGLANITTKNSLVWNSKVNPDSSKLFRYKLKYIDNDTLGLDFFEPAVLKYENETLYSQRISFIRKQLIDKRLFIQKSFRYSTNDGQVIVKLQVRNLGDTLENIYVKDFLGADDMFSEISKMPIDGNPRWNIAKLRRDEAWEVTYVTNDGPSLNLLPEVYGVDKSFVLKSLVFENEIRSSIILQGVQFMEKFALIFIPLFLIFYVIYLKREKNLRSLGIRKVGRKIHKLKESTKPDNRSSIDVMMKESKIEKDIPTPEGPDVPDYVPPDKRGSPKEVAKENINKLKKIDEETSK